MKRFLLAIIMVALLCGIASAQSVKPVVVFNWNVVRLDSLDADTTAWQAGQSYGMTWLSRYAITVSTPRPQLTTLIQYQSRYNNSGPRDIDTITYTTEVSNAADSLETLPYHYLIAQTCWRWRAITISKRDSTDVYKQTYNWR